MGWTSEMVAEAYSIPREKQDQYALLSHNRAEKAQSAGTFADEILPVEIDGQIISVDDTIRPGVTAQSLAGLKPSFPDWGSASTTAGNASGVGDGAAICIMTTRQRAEREGMEIIGKWVGTTVVGKFLSSCQSPLPNLTYFLGVQPRYMGIAPVVAIPKILGQLGLSKEDVDVYEVSNLTVLAIPC
jgi:acetyl-CoA acyltransferase 1